MDYGFGRNEAARQKFKKTLKEEKRNLKSWCFLSFAKEDTDRKYGVFLGAIILRARGMSHALLEISEKGINPHRQVLYWKIKKEDVPPAKYHNRLLTKEDILEFWPEAKSLGEINEG